jgi:hypothetical protein
MMEEEATAPEAKLSFAWDTNTAVAVMVLAALVFLWAVSRGFRGFTIGASS